ncbi:MAG: hypothetical protein NVS3B12_35340 [Acidimicrobiales bacterium]
MIRLAPRRHVWRGLRSLGTASLVVAALSVAGCSSGPRHSPAASATLQHDVDALRSAVSAKDRRSADAALAALNHDLEGLGGAGQLLPADVARIRSAGEAVRQQLSALPTTAVPATSTTVTTSTTTLPARSSKGGGDEGD